MRERVHKRFKNVVAVDLIHALEVLGIALFEYIPGFFPALFRQCQVQDVVFDPLAPEFVKFLRTYRPGRF